MAGVKSLSPNAFDRYIRAKFSEETRTISSTDIGAAFESFRARYPSLVEWYSALFLCAPLRVEWEADAPTIPVSDVSAWLRICNEFEPDVLLTFHLAWKRIGGGNAETTIRRFSGWRTIPRATDHELNVLWSRGLSDMHVHAGGVRIPQAAWLDIMRSERTQRAFTALRECYLESGRELNKDMETARAARSKLTAMVFGAAEEPDIAKPSGDRWWSWQSSNLARERELLLRAWQRLHAGCPGAEVLALEFDRYIDQKNRFFARVREPAFTAIPGLQFFTDRHYRAIQRSPPRTKWKTVAGRYGASKRLEMAQFGDACQYLFETEHLRRVELRIPPFDRAPDYWRFFRAWSTLNDRLNEGLKEIHREPVDIRFAVHFKRTRSKQGTRSQTGARLAELDKQSAALRVALACPERSKWLQALMRVDVAGHERDTSLASFAWHLRLMRESPETIRMLEMDRVPPPWSAYMGGWRRLEQRGLHKHVTGLRRLGTTVHAGEEFGDVLDGIYQIAAALDLCELRAGDGIGHGLVMAEENGRPFARSRFVTIPLGEAVDQLCWLRSKAGEFLDPSDLYLEKTKIDDAILRAAVSLYPAEFLRQLTPSDLVWLWEVKTGMREKWCEEVDCDPVKRRLLALEGDESFWMARDRFEPLVPRDELAQVVGRARKWLMKRICDRRVVIEMNPSSNLRISGSGSADANPTVFLARAVAQGLLACVNTDNPGVFASCIENEYALLLDGLNGDPCVNIREARDLMEMARRVGLEYLR